MSTTGHGSGTANPEDIKQKIINNFSQSAQTIKQGVENASNDLYRISDGNINLATRDLSNPATSIVEAAGRYTSQGSTSEENYFREQSKRMDKVIAVTSLIVGDYDQNKTARHYDSVCFEKQNVQELMSYNGYGTQAQDYANKLLTSSSTIYNVQSSAGAPGPATFQASGKGMKISSSERAEIARTGQFTRTVDGHTYTYSVGSFNGQQMTNAQVQSAILNANAETKHQNSVIGRVSQAHKIAAYNEIKNNSISNFNANLKSEGIEFKVGNRRECNKILNNINEKQQEILKQAMGNPAFASLQRDISKLTTQIKDSTIDAATKKNLMETLNKKNSQIRDIGDFQKRLDNLEKHKSLITTYRDDFSKGTDRKGGKTSHNAANSRLMGARIIGRGLMGDDMQQGIDFYKKGYQAASTSVKIVARSTALAGTAMECVGHAGANFGLKLVERYSTGKVNDTVNSLIKVNDNAHGKIKSMKQERKNLKAADRSGLGREYRRERKLSRANARAEKKTAKISATEKKVSELRSKTGPLSSKESRQLKIGERKLRMNNRKNQLAKKFDWVSKVKDRLSKVGKGVGKALGTIAKPFKLMAMPFQWLNKLKAMIIKYAVIGIGGVLLAYVSLTSILVIIAIIIRFVSSVVETDLTGIFDNRNFCQIIVDDVCENLAYEMEKVCRTDAETYYLKNDEGKVKHEKYDWYKGVNEGELRHIKAVEDGKEVPALTSNLLPIVSMMHYRYEDEINFDNWQTARAYVYYMYVTSHNISGYDYDDENDCDVNNIYLNGDYVKYDIDGKILIRPINANENCDNIYIHGYDSSYSKALNDLRASADEFLSMAIALLNEKLPEGMAIDNTTIDKKSGAWVNEKPNDPYGTCDNYKSYQYGKTKECLDLNKCPGEIHTHNKNDCYSNCSKDEHTHDSSCDIYGCSKDEHSHSDSCRWLSCTKVEHPCHEPWISEYNPGCYKTLYVCQGHCGGHITPQIDMVQEMTFEKLAFIDNFKTPYFITGFDFITANITDAIIPYRDLASWRAKWMKEFAKWFAPFPSSPIAAYTYTYGKLAYAGAQTIDAIKSMLFGIDTPEESSGWKSEDDKFDFKGWFPDVGEHATLDEMSASRAHKDLMTDLHDLYGVYDDNYKEGYQNWEDIGEVVFPVGNIRPLTSSQIADILKQLESRYPSLSESRWKVIEEALSKVGKYSYDLSAIGHQNGIYGESGRSECSGFVSGVLYRALGLTQYTSGWSASTYANAGHSHGGNPSPGDILAHANGGVGQNGTSYTGHVVIYLGYLDNGIEGYTSEACQDGAPAGHYIIECTNREPINGSCIRKVDENFFEGTYSKSYTGCY